ncbi:uncharacterized protein LOC110845386 [Folsomia candida]|uniref:Uncharacterized protein n=1 Tax=Folsomia candida TaxID=158441 RepID=A0A226EL75_FOLCA|nr:uncharacterized protein LOC110845386 [Folsomia candida]OXA58050.1 hypothetical protein Fcan01_07100 [Folsomia candida]
MEKVDAVPGNAPGTSASSNALEITVAPPSTPHPSPVPRPRREQSAKDSRCCFHFAKFETFIYIVGVFGIVMGIAKIVVIALHISKLYDHYEDSATYYMCGIGIFLSAIVVAWEVPLLYFVRTRKLVGLQQYMFAMMLHFLGSCILAVVTGAYYQRDGLFLSMSFIADIIRVPPQMLFVHKFIKAEKLNEDSHFVAAYYKKF